MGSKENDFHAPFCGVSYDEKEKEDADDKKVFDHFQCRKCHYVLKINGQLPLPKGRGLKSDLQRKS